VDADRHNSSNSHEDWLITPSAVVHSAIGSSAPPFVGTRWRVQTTTSR